MLDRVYEKSDFQPGDRVRLIKSYTYRGEARVGLSESGGPYPQVGQVGTVQPLEKQNGRKDRFAVAIKWTEGNFNGLWTDTDCIEPEDGGTVSDAELAEALELLGKFAPMTDLKGVLALMRAHETGLPTDRLLIKALRLTLGLEAPTDGTRVLVEAARLAATDQIQTEVLARTMLHMDAGGDLDPET